MAAIMARNIGRRDVAKNIMRVGTNALARQCAPSSHRLLAREEALSAANVVLTHGVCRSGVGARPCRVEMPPIGRPWRLARGGDNGIRACRGIGLEIIGAHRAHEASKPSENKSTASSKMKCFPLTLRPSPPPALRGRVRFHHSAMSNS